MDVVENIALMTKIIIDFVMNNLIAVFVIGSSAYIIAGMIMRFCHRNFGIWFGRSGGKLLWLTLAISISALYHFIVEMFDK